MSQWQIVSLIALIGWLVLAVRRLNSRQLDANIVMRSILIWGAIVLVIAVIVLNLDTIAAVLAPVRAMMP
jgi:hypothetical protein